MTHYYNPTTEHMNKDLERSTTTNQKYYRQSIHGKLDRKMIHLQHCCVMLIDPETITINPKLSLHLSKYVSIVEQLVYLSTFIGNDRAR